MADRMKGSRTRARTAKVKQQAGLLTKTANMVDRNSAIEWAKSMVNSERVLIFDTETTGIRDTDEIIQIAFMNTKEEIVYETRLKPKKRSIHPDAEAKHGISMAMLKDAPTIKEVFPVIQKLVDGKILVAYNAAYDLRLLRRTCAKAGLIDEEFNVTCQCSMLQYARFVGEWNPRYNSYKWHKLPGASHGAAGDCRALLRLINRMASSRPSLTGCAASVLWFLFALSAVTGAIAQGLSHGR